MITRDDVIDLLKLAAVFDQRTVGEEDIKGWLLAGRIGRWTGPLATRVLVEHYASDSDRPRIDPARITDAIRKVRSRAAESFVAPRIPEGLDGQGRAYLEWYREQLHGHVDDLLARWADGAELPVGAKYPALGSGLAGGTPAQRAALEAFTASTRIPEA
jgi:hypothetical protein